MEVFRLSTTTYNDHLSGIGAASEGARWNSKGVECVYTASSRALAMAEVTVHTKMKSIKKDYLMVPVYIPDSIEIKLLDSKLLPKYWSIFPAPKKCAELGDQLLNENEYCVFKVPSAVVKNDYNYILNPGHSDFGRIYALEKEYFQFDRRIFEI